MEDGIETLTDEKKDLGISLNRWTREIFGSNQHWCHSLGGEQLSNALVACDSYRDVCGMGQPVRVDDGRVGHVCRGDADGATGKRCYESDRDRGIVVAVIGATGDKVVLISKVTTNVQILDLRPIRREPGKGGLSLVGERSSGRGWNFLPCCDRQSGIEWQRDVDKPRKSPPVLAKMPVWSLL